MAGKWGKNLTHGDPWWLVVTSLEVSTECFRWDVNETFETWDVSISFQPQMSKRLWTDTHPSRNIAVDFIGLVAPGIPSSKCVRVLADDGNDWVVRPLWNESGSWGKRLFNQYVASTLALKIGLSTPEIALIDIERIRQILERIGMNSATSLGVATRYVEGLSSPLMPIDYNPVDADFPTTNRKYLTTILGDQFDFSQFYAYRVFSRWLCLEDDAWWRTYFFFQAFRQYSLTSTLH